MRKNVMSILSVAVFVAVLAVQVANLAGPFPPTFPPVSTSSSIGVVN